MQINVYSYSNPREFLQAVLHHKKRVNSRFSLRSWSKQLGFANPSTLSAVLSGKRSLTPTVATKIYKTLDLSPDERRYLELLVLVNNAGSAEEKEVYLNLLTSLNPTRTYVAMDTETFRLIADWQHLTILEMVHLKDFEADTAAIAKALGGELTKAMVQEAIERLLRLGLLKVDDQGRLQKSTDDLHIGDELPSEAIRAHHAQMLQRAAAALESQPMHERDVRGTTIPIKSEDLPKLIELTKEYHKNVHALAAAKDADEVYRINTQCFKLSDWQRVASSRKPVKAATNRKGATTHKGAGHETIFVEP